MAGAAIWLSRGPARADGAQIAQAIDPLANCRRHEFRSPDARAWLATRTGSPCAGISGYEDETFLGLLAGDVINPGALDWTAICRGLLTEDPDHRIVTDLRGAFALLLLHKQHRELCVVTDPFGWQPVYAAFPEDTAFVSTSLGAFFGRSDPPPRLSEEWLYESLFFNHGIGTRTPLTGVTRIPGGTILRHEGHTGRTVSHRYHRPPCASRPRRTGPEAVAEAIEVFQRVVPRYVPETGPTVLGLSAGLDCRAVLAALPDDAVPCLDSFTYGIPGTSEIEEADGIARTLGLAQKSVALDGAFASDLPRLARETVRLSDGLQNINRSHLLFVYRQLARNGQPHAALLTGVSGDHIFRDHLASTGNVPHILSAHAAAMWRDGRQRLDKDCYAAIVGERWPCFEAIIENALDTINDEYGEFGDPHAYLTYLMQEAGPHYFGGQAAIANCFTSFRTPYWDPDIVRLGYELEYATVGFSAAKSVRQPRKECLLQASVVAASKTLSRIPYRQLSIDAFSKNDPVSYQLARAGRKIRRVVTRRTASPGETWSDWYRTPGMDAEIRALLGNESRIRDYVGGRFVDRIVASTDVHWIGKLMTAEHTLRLVENGWREAPEPRRASWSLQAMEPRATWRPTPASGYSAARRQPTGGVV